MTRRDARGLAVTTGSGDALAAYDDGLPLEEASTIPATWYTDRAPDIGRPRPKNFPEQFLVRFDVQATEATDTLQLDVK